MPRIVDERTGKRCDYSALRAEAVRLMRAEKISWRPAIQRVAELANIDQADSIVRNLNRNRPEERRSPPLVKMENPPGAMILLALIGEKVEQLTSEAPLVTMRDLGILRSTLREMSAVVERRIRDIEAAEPVDMEGVRRISWRDHDFRAENLRDLEMSRLGVLRDKITRLDGLIMRREREARQRDRGGPLDALFRR